MLTAYRLTAYGAYLNRISLFDIDRVGLDDSLLFPVAVAFAAGGACAVGDLHYLDGVVRSVGLLGLPEGDGDGGDGGDDDGNDGGDGAGDDGGCRDGGDGDDP